VPSGTDVLGGAGAGAADDAGSIDVGTDGAAVAGAGMDGPDEATGGGVVVVVVAGALSSPPQATSGRASAARASQRDLMLGMSRLN
jgi:hypothetical protein